MFSRRQFLSAGMGMSVAACATDGSACPDGQFGHRRGAEEISPEDSRCRELLGRPRSPADVEEGFHPISPERVVILGSSDHTPRWPLRELVDRLRRRFPGLAPASSGPEKSRRQMLNDGSGKLGLIVWLMDILTTYYHIPDEVDRWAEALALREYWYPTGRGEQVTLLGGFQRAGVAASNPPVDWWLCLFPEGFADWSTGRASARRPLRVMLAHAFSKPPAEDPRLSTAATRLASQALAAADMESTNWEDISRMNRIDAARLLNARVTSTLRNCRAWQ